ncbi:MAG: hypothetical protein HUU57_02765 [Bdellovibrio sp.]|nr:hypothetical protein [Bdellovibrio sp.]
MKSILISYLLLLFTLSALGAELEEQVLEVSTIGGVILSDPIIALSKGTEVFLPLLDTAKILGIQVEQPDKGIFKIYRTPTDLDTIDLSNCPNSSLKACKSLVKQKENFYLNIEFLKDSLQWPLSINLKSMVLSVNVDPKSKNIVRQSNEPRPYKIIRKQFDYPALRLEATASSEKNNNLLNVYESQPLLNHDSDMVVSTSPQQTYFRWTISKEVIESTAPYEIKNYELGSTQTVDTKYLFSPTLISGVHFSNIKSGENIFDTQNLYEKGPPRWKVEIYVNDIYLGETSIDINGNFSFTNVPIFYGLNKIRYRMTSPIGNIVEIDRTLNVSSDFQGAGRLKYQASFGQAVGNANYVGSGALSYGLTSNMSAQLGLSQFALPNASDIKRYSTMGLSYLQPSFSLGLQKLTSFDNQENAWIYTPKANVGRVLITGEYANFENLKTALINPHNGDSLNSLKKISLLAPIQFQYPVTAQLAFQESTFTDIASNQQLQARIYSMLPSSSLLLESNKFWPSDAKPDLYVEYGNYNRSFRGKYGVLIQNDKYAKTKMELEYLLENNLYLTLSANLPPALKNGSYAAGANKIIHDIQCELNISYSEIQTLYSLTLSTNIKTKQEDGFQLSHEESYRQANIEVFAFIDENSNGKFDIGEKPYPKLRVLETNRQKDYITNESGIATIPSLSPYQRVSLEIVKESITNIFLTAQDFQSDFILTPAQQLRIELPIKPSFDVRGIIVNPYFKKLVPLEILDSNNNIIGTTLSSSSGKYKFTDLPGGTYFIRISQDFLVKNHLRSNPELIAVDLLGKAGARSAEQIYIEVINKN